MTDHPEMFLALICISMWIGNFMCWLYIEFVLLYVVDVKLLQQVPLPHVVPPARILIYFA